MKTTGSRIQKSEEKLSIRLEAFESFLGYTSLTISREKPIIEIFLTPMYQDDCGWPSAGPPPSWKHLHRTVLEKYGIETTSTMMWFSGSSGFCL